MILIDTVSDKVFSLNGVNYAKIYQPLKQGVEAIGIFNIYDVSQKLITSTSFQEFKIDGAVYTTQEETIAAILDVTFELELTGTVTALLESKTNKGGYEGTAQDLFNLINGSTSGFQGDLAVADTPTSDGYYFASQTGTYSNAGGLVVNLANGLSIIVVSGGVTVFEQIVVPLSSANFVEFSDIEGLQSRALDALINASGIIPITTTPVATIAATVLNSDGTVSSNASFKTTDYLLNSSVSAFDYYEVTFSPFNDNGFANLVYYNGSSEKIYDFMLDGRRVIGVPPSLQVKISVTNGGTITKLVTRQALLDVTDKINQLQELNYRNWVDIPNSSNLTNANALLLLNAIKALDITIDDSISTNTLKINTFCTTPTSLSSSYAFLIEIRDESESPLVHFRLESIYEKNGIGILSGQSSDGLRKGTAIVDWSLLPDPFQFYGDATIRIQKNKYNVLCALAEDVNKLKLLNNITETQKKILAVGTSITQGSTYVQNAADANGYIVYNKGIGSSGICLNTGILGNGRDGIDLSETIAEKEARYTASVTPEVLETYRNASWERVIKPYLDGTIDTVDAIWFDHGYNDRNQIYSELANIDSVNWELSPSADRSKFSGAFIYLMYQIFLIKPDVKIIISGFLEGESDNSKRGGAGIKQMHERIAKIYGFPLMKVYDYTGFNFLHVPNSANFISDYNTAYGTSYGVFYPDSSGNVSFYQYYCPDSVHPYSDKQGITQPMLDKIYSKLLNKLV